MFKFFSNLSKQDALTDEHCAILSEPIVTEIKEIHRSIPKNKLFIYEELFNLGFVAGYIKGVTYKFGTDGCCKYNIKDTPIHLFMCTTDVYKVAVHEIYGDTVMAQSCRSMNAQEEYKPELFNEGLKYGIADGQHWLKNGEFVHYLKQQFSLDENGNII